MHKVSASKVRLGVSVGWLSLNSPLYFFKVFRLNIILNSYLRGFLKFFRIRLVKWFMHVEARFLKIGLITFNISRNNNLKKIKRWKRVFPAIWNYTYIDKITLFLKKTHKILY